MQYLYCMFEGSGKLKSLDNSWYPDLAHAKTKALGYLHHRAIRLAQCRNDVFELLFRQNAGWVIFKRSAEGQEKCASRARLHVLVAPQGFEPRSSESESLVLPLNEGAIGCCRAEKAEPRVSAATSGPTAQVYEALGLRSI